MNEKMVKSIAMCGGEAWKNILAVNEKLASEFVFKMTSFANGIGEVVTSDFVEKIKDMAIELSQKTPQSFESVLCDIRNFIYMGGTLKEVHERLNEILGKT